MTRKPKDPHRVSYEGKITLLTLAAVVPAILVALALLWFGDYSAKVQWTLTILIIGCFGAFISSTREHTVRPLQTMSNLLAALREGDYSVRARGAREGSALGEVLLEVNSLGETLRLQRLGAFEATALLRTIMSEIDVSLSIPNGVCASSIAPVKLCWVSRWTSCWAKRQTNLQSTDALRLTRTSRLL